MIAAIPIGYADGLNRHLGRGRCYCLVNGQKAPYVGNICMDVAMIDVTDIPCQEGDTVEIFGDHLKNDSCKNYYYDPLPLGYLWIAVPGNHRQLHGPTGPVSHLEGLYCS